MTTEAIVIPAHLQACAYMVVDGDCMTGDGICSGDFILVDTDAPVKDGDIVAVTVNGMALVKRAWVLPTGEYLLVPSNPRYKPEISSAEIIGKVTGVLHMF